MMPMYFSNPLTFITEEEEREINVKDICGSLAESVVNDNITEMTKNIFLHYQCTIMNPLCRYNIGLEIILVS